MTKLPKEIASRDTHISKKATAKARKASNLINIIQLHKAEFMFHPAAVNILSLLSAALSECEKYKALIHHPYIDDSIREIRNTMTSISGLEADRISSVIAENTETSTK